MVDINQLEILQEALDKQNCDIWNDWKAENDAVQVDLSELVLAEVDLSGINLTNANLSRITLRSVSLSDANLQGVDLSRSYINHSTLINTNLTNSNLTGANLSGTTLVNANLSGATLKYTNLTGVNLSGARLRNSDMIYAKCDKTLFTDVDLSETKNLDHVHHISPSCVGIDSLEKSKGKICAAFLRGCSVPETMISFAHSLVNNPIDYYSCFISYSTADKEFATLLFNTLQGRGIRCWFAPEQLQPGQRIDEGINRGIQYWDKVIFCASKSSLTEKWWVDFELDKAFDKEMNLQQQLRAKVGVLISLNLDDYIFEEEYEVHPRSSLIKTNLVADFVGWRNDMNKFNQEIRNVIKSLKTSSNEKTLSRSKFS